MNQIQNIPLLDLSEREPEFRAYLERQVIPDPPDDLLSVYEQRILHEHSYFRAEKYDSPEHQEELKKIQAESDNPDKVPRNIQNPNYDKLMDYYHKIVNSKTVPEAVNKINEMYNFLTGFNLVKKFKYQPVFLETSLDSLDPRFFEQEPDFSLFLSYLLTKVRNRIAQQEFECLLHLTEKKFDDESIAGALDSLRDVRENSHEYEVLANQLREAVISDGKYELNPSQTQEIKKPEEYQSLDEFLNYLYVSMT